MSKFPKVKIDEISLTENDYISNDGKVYNALKLIEASKGLTVFKIPLASLDLSDMPFNVDNTKSLLYQINRINKTNLKYPIILDDKGVICDGRHRVCKAILKGKRTIKAVRLEVMPDYDRIEKD